MLNSFIDNLYDFVTKNNVKVCVSNYETGEYVEPCYDVRNLKHYIQISTKNDNFNYLYITGTDIKSVDYLKEYAIKCRNYYHSTKLVQCDCCQSLIEVSKKYVENDGWVCPDCMMVCD